MSPLSPRNSGRRDYLTLVLLVVSAVAAIAMLRTAGVIIVVIAAIVLGMYLARSSTKPETASLRGSVRLSAESLTAVLEEYDDFRSSPDADHLADRTLYRPALLDPGNRDAEISTFHQHRAAADRFLRRLEGHLQNPNLSVRELESLLDTTDERARRLEQSWWDARRAARRLGPDSG